jgi:hypothetical protein
MSSTGRSAVPSTILETFEEPFESWKVYQDVSGDGASVTRTDMQAAAGSYAARVATKSKVGQAYLRVDFSEPAANHQWEERPGTWHWQQASIYLPATAVAQLGPDDHLTLAGLWPSSGGSFGWFLRVKHGGELAIFGYTVDGKPVEFKAHGTFPQDRWVELEVGLHSQNGPGVKRAFAFLIDGAFYGWYRQGHMEGETYDHAAFGILSTNSDADLEVLIDQWREPSSSKFPAGPDTRSSASLQNHDYRNESGVQVQYDWSTWEYHPTLDRQFGLYTPMYRLQAGRNIDRMPELVNGWAEIEIDWPKGIPTNITPNGYFGPMVGFRKEFNREENLEVIPIGTGDGQVNLALEA